YAKGQRTPIGNKMRRTKYLHTLVTRSLPVSVSAIVVFTPLTLRSRPAPLSAPAQSRCTFGDATFQELNTALLKVLGRSTIDRVTRAELVRLIVPHRI